MLFLVPWWNLYFSLISACSHTIIFSFLLQWIIFVSGHMRTNVELKENFIFSFTHSHHLVPVVKKSPIVFISIHVLYCLLRENRRSVSLVVVQEQMVCNFMDIICGILIYAV